MNKYKAKYLQIAESLRKEITEGKHPDGFLPSEGTLCEKHNVSRITVRGALKHLEELGQLFPVPGKGWKISDRQQRHAASPKVKNIACLCNPRLPAYGIVFNALSSIAEEAGYSISMLFNTGDSIEQFKEQLKPENFCGIISIGVVGPKTIKGFSNTGLPTVYAVYDYPLAKDSVGTDDFDGGWLAADHLLNNGHRNIMIANKKKIDPAFSSREEGFMRRLREEPSGKISCHCLDSPHESESSRKELIKLLKSENSPSAMFFTTDGFAAALLSILKSEKMQIPKDISLIGYDNFINEDIIPDIPIDSVEQPWEKIAEYSFKRLMDKISFPDESSHLKIQLQPKLIIKGSVKKIK